MSPNRQIPTMDALEAAAAQGSVAVAVVDPAGNELTAFNNNSICRTLNPEGRLTGQCAAFCGTALEESTEVGGPVSFTCHAGLECRAAAFVLDGKPVAVIAGRVFASAENYRRATQRAANGDWAALPPSELFENVSIAGSKNIAETVIDQISAAAAPAEMVEAVPALPAEDDDKGVEVMSPPRSDKLPNLVEKFNREVGLAPEGPLVRKPAGTRVPAPKSEPATSVNKERRSEEARAWRSFFGSLLRSDYPRAADSILRFLADQFGFTAIIWLDRVGDRFEKGAAIGEMKDRKVRLGIAPDDARLIETSHRGLPLELGERSRTPEAEASRTMNMFPVGVGDDISASIAVLDPISNDGVKKQIVRICRSIAPQLEILRLRGKVREGETLAAAVRRFGDGLKRIDSDDFWLSLTQNVAEMLNAERASLLTYNEKAEALELKAIVGGRTEVPAGEIGSRVSRIIFEKNEPVIVTDVAKSGLSPAPADRGYKTASFLSSPINIGSRTIGVMNFTDRANGASFDRASLEMFQAIAAQLAVAVDRAALKEMAGEFETLSVTDVLTDLRNRRYIEERLLEEIKRSNRHGYTMSFMMLDVDEFKSYNDTFGHPAGDEALKIVAQVMRETLRGADVAARFGGEEFSILLPQTTGAEAKAIAERIRHNIENARFPHRRVTVSIGVASCSADLCVSSDLVRAADKALYAAKGRGRNQVIAFEELGGPNNN